MCCNKNPNNGTFLPSIMPSGWDAVPLQIPMLRFLTPPPALPSPILRHQMKQNEKSLFAIICFISFICEIPNKVWLQKI